MQKKNGFVEFHHFIKNERLNNSNKTFLNQWETMGFCTLQTKMKFSRQDWDMLTIFILPQNKTEKEIKSKVKIIATIASQN